MYSKMSLFRNIGRREAKADEAKLDLKALQSYSPSWSPTLRYTVCIGARYAAQECLKQLHRHSDVLLSQAPPKDSDKTEHFEEEGEEEEGKNTSAETIAANAKRRQRRRIEYAQDWEEFTQKVTALDIRVHQYLLKCCTSL